jgi:hypothetical protein
MSDENGGSHRPKNPWEKFQPVRAPKRGARWWEKLVILVLAAIGGAAVGIFTVAATPMPIGRERMYAGAAIAGAIGGVIFALKTLTNSNES